MREGRLTKKGRTEGPQNFSNLYYYNKIIRKSGDPINTHNNGHYITAIIKGD